MKHITNYKPKDFAELLNVSGKILQRWDRDNVLKAFRTPTDRRYYTYDQYLEFKGINNISIEVEEKHQLNTNQGIGIDLGLKDFAICSNGITKKNINKTNKVKKLEKKSKKEQKQLSRKYESLKQRNKSIKKEGGIATRQNIQKQKLKVQKLHQTLSNIRENYLNQIVNELVKTKPSHITIEDLNVRGMMKNRHLSKAMSKQGFNMFRVKLNNKCNEYGIELRIVDRYYPSSKTCHECGSIKNDLKLSDRVYICKECGCEIDRDLNASLNLRDVKIYKIA